MCDYLNRSIPNNWKLYRPWVEARHDRLASMIVAWWSTMEEILTVPASKEKKTTAGVFIIESLSIEDETNHRFEGRILQDILKLSEKKVEYWYVRTWKEVKAEMFQRFYDSGLRYLHISCHGNENTISFTLDNVTFENFGQEIKPYLHERRLFFSACEVVNQALHGAVMPGSDCYSIIGPEDDIRFDDAVIMWGTFYHLMLRDATAMKSADIRAALQKIKATFGRTFKYL